MGESLAQDIRLVRLDSTQPDFHSEFAQYESDFFAVLRHSYSDYHGDAYHSQRIIEGGSILYFGFYAARLVGASYVKRNLRRGGTAVFPPEFRRHGVASLLIQASLVDFPEQYSILGAESEAMITLLQHYGFERVNSRDEIARITGSEFSRLSGWDYSSAGLVFERRSDKREVHRPQLILLRRRADVG